MINQPFFTVQDIASRWGVSESHVFSLGAAGCLKFGVFIPGAIHVEIGSYSPENNDFEVESSGLWSGFIPVSAEMVASIWQSGAASRLSIPNTDCGKAVCVISDVPFDECDQTRKLLVAGDDLEKFEASRNVLMGNGSSKDQTSNNGLLTLANESAEKIRQPGVAVSLSAVARYLTNESVRSENKDVLWGQKGWHEQSWIKNKLKGWKDPKPE